MNTQVTRGSPEGRFLGLLRAAALIAVLAGAGGSVGLTLRAGQRTPRFLLAIIAIWVLSPFVALVWTNLVSERWSVLTRVALYIVTLTVTLVSVAVYAVDAKSPIGAHPAFVYVLVPPVSWLLIAIVVLVAASISARLSRRSDGS